MQEFFDAMYSLSFDGKLCLSRMAIQLPVVKNAERGQSVLCLFYFIQRLFDGTNLLGKIFMTKSNCEYCITAHQTTIFSDIFVNARGT